MLTVSPWRTLDVTLDLKDPQYPEHNLGTLDLAVTLSPKDDIRDAVRKLHDSTCTALSHKTLPLLF